MKYVILSVIIVIISSCTKPEPCTITEPHYHDGELYYKLNTNEDG